MLFEKVVNPDVNLVKRDVNHLFSENDFPELGQKSKLFEARNCYIRIEYINDIEVFTDDMDVINKFKNKQVYFVEFGLTVEELGDKRKTIVLENVYENFVDVMDGAIEYLNDYLIKEREVN